MPLEIRELIVKVTVDAGASSNETGFTHQDKKKLVDECVRKVMKELKSKRER
ncbi:MAG: DUF5908 family protein [Bacteroidota bacterium]